jgi:phosphoribosylaminoimidazole-succinocarboxamide synthase
MAFSARYVRLFETVTGQSFQYPDPELPVRDRVRAALQRSFPEYF